MTTPPVALLLDVDGPIASPDTRTVRIASVAKDLAALANAGALVVFNTGRAAAFIRDVVVPVVREAGLNPGVRLWAICEKGAVWFGFDAETLDEPAVDDELSLDAWLGEWVEARLDEQYSETMFFDHDKLAMVSVEAHVEADRDAYYSAQDDFDDEIFDEIVRRGGGVERRDRVKKDGDGNVTVRIDPTIISTDIEHPGVGKDIGAARAITLATEAGFDIPQVWRTMGDSRTDYAMADWLHEHGYSVAHIDVRPADGVPAKPYPVLQHAELIHDESGAHFFAKWREITAAGGWAPGALPDSE